MDSGTGTLLLSRPVTPLWRAPGVLQLDADATVVLERVPKLAAQAVALLATPQTPATLRHLLPEADGRWLDWLVGELCRAGLLVLERPAPSRTITLVGSGPLAIDLTRALDAAGFGSVQRLASGNESVAVSQHWSRFLGPWADLVVVAAHTAEPDRTLTEQLVRSGKPHLIVRVEASRAVVGPFVLPGASACVRCLDLVHAHFDSAWPVILSQLCRATPEPPSGLRDWAVSTAVLQVRAHAAGGIPDAVGRTIEVSWDDPAIKATTVPLHPECGCAADV